MNIVTGNVVDCRLIEVELRGLHSLAVSGLPGAVEIGGKILDGVVGGELPPADKTIAVVEGREDDRCTELPLIDQVLRLLIKAVDAERQRLVQQLLLYAKIVVIGALGDRGGVQSIRARRHGGGAGKLRKGPRADELKGRRREIARIAAVERRARIELPHRVDARTQLTAA